MKRRMTGEERKLLVGRITLILVMAVSSDYARHILESREDEDGDTFLDLVIDDVLTSSAWEDEGYYNDDDIRLAIGRVLMDKLNLWY